MNYNDLVGEWVIHLGKMEFPFDTKRVQDSDLEELTRVLQRSKVTEILGLHLSQITLADGKLTNVLANNHTLKHLSLHGNQIGSAGAKQLAAALKVNATLQVVNLGENQIGSDGARHIADALVANTNLVLEVLYLSANRITLLNRRFADALANNHTLKVLSLYDNQIGNAGAKQLAAALSVNKTLQKVNLGKNHIGNDGAQHLADALVANTNLHTIRLRSNTIGDEGAKCFAKSLLANRCLRMLYLDENQITDNGAKTLANALKRNRTIECVALRNNHISKEMIDAIKYVIKDPKRKECGAEKSTVASLLTEKGTIGTKDVDIIGLEEDSARLREDIARNDTELGKRYKEISLKNEQIASSKGTLNVDLTLDGREPSNKRPRAGSIAKGKPLGQGMGGGPVDSGKPVYDHVFHYVTTIKKRFASHPEIYREFMDILYTYEKEERGIKEVFDEVSLLFADHADLLKEFTYFLPDAEAQLDVAAKKRIDDLGSDSGSSDEDVAESRGGPGKHCSAGATGTGHMPSTTPAMGNGGSAPSSGGEGYVRSMKLADDKEEGIRMLKETIAQKEAEIEERKAEIASKNDEIASLRKALGIDVNDLTGGDDPFSKSDRPQAGQKKKPRLTSQENSTAEVSVVGRTGGASTNNFTRSKRSTVKIKQEDIVNGNVKCPDPECLNIIPFAEGRCNVMVCTNHSPQFLYFCIHCKEVNDNGMDYATCRCSRRNTKETRIEAQKIRNELSAKNPIDLV